MLRLAAIVDERQRLMAELEELEYERDAISTHLRGAEANPTVLRAVEGACHSKTLRAEAQEYLDSPYRPATVFALCANVRLLLASEQGSTLVLRFLEAADEAELIRFIRCVSAGDTLVRAARSRAGSRVLARFAELIVGSPDLSFEFYEYVGTNIRELCRDAHASEVIRRALCNGAFYGAGQVARALAQHLDEIACDRVGSRTLELALSTLVEAEHREYLLQATVEHAVKLAKDGHGNFLVQRAAERSLATYYGILRQLVLSVESVAVDRFGSVVLERLLRQAPMEALEHICRELMPTLSDGSVDTEPLMNVVNNSYGNYIAQALVELLPLELFQSFRATLYHTLGMNQQGQPTNQRKGKSGRRAVSPAGSDTSVGTARPGESQAANRTLYASKLLAKVRQRHDVHCRMGAARGSKPFAPPVHNAIYPQHSDAASHTLGSSSHASASHFTTTPPHMSSPAPETMPPSRSSVAAPGTAPPASTRSGSSNSDAGVPSPCSSPTSPPGHTPKLRRPLAAPPRRRQQMSPLLRQHLAVQQLAAESSLSSSGSSKTRGSA